MASFDVNTRKYLYADLVNFVQSRIRDKLEEAVVAELISVGEISPQTWKIAVHNIAKSTKESSAMSSVLETAEGILHSGVENIISNIENEPVSDFPETRTVLQRSSKEGWYRDSACEGSQFEQLARETSLQTSLKRRKEALNICNQTVLSEIVSSKSWSQIRQNLKENLCEESMDVFNSSLKIHAKLMQSTSQTCIKDGFINLIEGLHIYYSKTYYSYLPDFKNGLDLNNPVHHHICHICNLILEAAKEMPKNWLRYGERRVDEIVGMFVTILAMHTYESKYKLPKTTLYPFHVLSMLDPKAKWCTQWSHGTFSHHLFLNKLSQNSALISFLVEEILSYLEHNENECFKNISQVNLASSAVNYATFIHSVSILNKIIPYEKRYKLFPVLVKSSCNSISLENLAVSMIKYSNFGGNYSSNVLSLPSTVEVVKQFIMKVLQHGTDQVRDVVFKALLGPVYHRNIQQAALNIPNHVIDVLLSLSEDSSGTSVLLGTKQKQKVSITKACRNQNSVSSSATSYRRNRNGSVSSDREYSARSIRIPSTSSMDASSPAKVIEFVTTTFLRNHDSSNSAKLLSLLKICNKIYKIHEGLSLLGAVNSQLLLASVTLYKQLSSQSDMNKCISAFGQPSQTTDCDVHSLYGSITGFLTAVASTPSGLYALTKEDTILRELFLSFFHPSNVSWKNPEFRRLVSLVAMVPDGVSVLSEMSCRILSKPLCILWAEYEDPVALMTGSDRKQQEAIQYFMNIIFTFVPNLQGVKALLAESEGSSEGTLVETDPGPLTLSELLTFDSVEPGPWHNVALLTLRALTSNMDVSLYLNSSILFQEKLLKLQSENVTSDEEEGNAENLKEKSIIIDECSILRHQILVSTYITGGPTERTIPLTIRDEKQLHECGDLRLSYGLPSLHTISQNKTRNARVKSQTEFYKFLQDTKDGVHDVNWLSHARRAYKSSRNEDIKESVLLDLIEQVAKLSSSSESSSNVIWPNADVALFPEECLGIEIAVRYGVSCHLLQERAQNEVNLAKLIQLSHSFMQTSSTDFQGFDWFMATMFLLCGGNMERCHSCIENMTSLVVTPFLWPALAATRVHSESGLSQRSAMFGHLLELLVKIELPLVFSALELAGASWWLICRQWMAQCFWNTLDWTQICHWLVICILNQPDFVLYFCICLLRHMQPQIIQAASEGNLWEQILLNPVEGFHVGDQLSFMEKLAKRYRTSVLHHLLGQSCSST